MQEQVHIHFNLPSTPKKLHELRIVELRLEQIIQRHLRAGAGHGNGTVAAFEREDADFVAADGEINVLPLAFGVAVPGDQDAAVGEFLGAVFERAEFGDAAGPGEFAFVVPLFGEGHQEAFLALFVLQRHHCLLNVIVVGLELLFEVGGLVVEAGEGETDAFELALTLNATAVLGADVDGDFVEEVLVVVVPSETANVLKPQNVLERGTFELSVGKGGEIDDGSGFRVGASSPRVGGELIVHNCSPAVFIFHGDGFHHDLHEIGTRLDPDDVEDATFRLHEKRFTFGVGI